MTIQIQTSYSSHRTSGTGSDEKEPQSVIHDPRNARDLVRGLRFFCRTFINGATTVKSPKQTILGRDNSQSPSTGHEGEPNPASPHEEDTVRSKFVATISANSRFQLGNNSTSPSLPTQTASKATADSSVDRVTPRPLLKYECKESEKSPSTNSSNGILSAPYTIIRT